MNGKLKRVKKMTHIKIDLAIVKLNLEFYMDDNNDTYFIVANDNETPSNFWAELEDVELEDVFVEFVDEHFCIQGQDNVYTATSDGRLFALDENVKMQRQNCQDCPIRDCQFSE